MRLAALMRFAVRDLRGGFQGLRIFLGCIAIGVFAIVAVNSLADALQAGLARDGRTILGGDVAFSLIHRQLEPDERAFLAAHGELSDLATTRAMALSEAGEATLVDLKAVDAKWPALGRAEFAPALAAAEVVALEDGPYGAAVDDAFLERLHLKVGDSFRLAGLTVQIRARIVAEPDRLATGIGFGARALVSLEALKASGLVQPGALIRWTTRVNMGFDPPSETDVAALIAQAKAKFPSAGWDVRGRGAVSPELSRNVDRFGEYLALIGLVSLVVGGVGVGNAAAGFVERKRGSLAILKALGASGGDVVALALIEFLIVAFAAAALGGGLGAMVPFLVAALAGGALPLPLQAAIFPSQLALGALFGLLTAFAFSIAPLGRVHDASVSTLFRESLADDAVKPRWRYYGLALLGGAALAGLAFVASPQKTVAVVVIVATALALLALRLVALGAMALARRAPRMGSVEVRLAISNLYRPGAPTPSVVISLGLGLAVIVALALVDVNLRGQLRPMAEGATPNFYFVDVRNSDLSAFRAFLNDTAPGAKIVEAPMMRGRVVRIGDIAAVDVKAKESAQWALEGDRGVTFADAPPEGSEVVAGAWWGKDYGGPPLVSVEADIADGIGLRVGDKLTINVLGRNVTAQVANLRKVNWRSFAINFVFVFSPSTFRGAPYSVLATAALPPGAPAADELKILRAVAERFPTVSTVRVREALDTVEALVAKLALAIRAASGLALATSVLTLAGALAANRSARLKDAVTLKVLGATRARLMAMYAIEYATLGAATALFGVGAGALAAYVVVAKVMAFEFHFAGWTALGAALGGLALTVLLGMAGVWRILGLSPAKALREP